MIHKELAAFLEEGIAINIGTRSASLQPNGARVVAVQVDEDGIHITAFVPADAMPMLLPDLEASRQAALVFARPPDERACQVKGTFEGARPATEDERPFVVDQWARWMRRLETIGLPRIAYESWHIWPCTAVRMKATALFDQTPGPDAGKAIR
jgi:hypothetical protein